MAEILYSDVLSCNICTRPYDTYTVQPKIAPCGHTSCSLCLKSILQPKQKLTCPFCRQTFSIKQGIEGLPLNYSLLQIIENSSGKQPTFCEVHEGYKNDHVCLEDKKEICLSCHIYGSHKGHKVLTFSQLETETSERFNLFKKKNEEFEDKRLNFQSFIKTRKDEVTQIIIKTFQGFSLELKQREEQLLKSAEEYFLLKQKDFESNQNYESGMNLLSIIEKFASEKVRTPMKCLDFLNLTEKEIEGPGAIHWEDDQIIENDSIKMKLNKFQDDLMKLKKDFDDKVLQEMKSLVTMLSPEILRPVKKPSFARHPLQPKSQQINSESAKERLICVSTMKGVIELKLAEKETISAVKETIKKIINYDAKIDLEYRNQFLQDSLTLNHYNILSSIPLIVKISSK